MNKKMTWVVLTVLVLAMFASSALALPSKTTDNMVTTLGVTTSTGATAPADFFASVSDPKVDAVAATILTTLSSGDKLMDAFTPSVVSEIASILPAGTNVENLQMNELVALNIGAYDANAYGEMTASFVFATEYAEGTAIVVLVGIIADDGSVTWYPVPGTVVAGGAIEVTFPTDVLEKMANASVALGVLS